jgi:cytidylate kinase
MLIAIDGPAASGKGTVARMIAKQYSLEHLDTGRLYRLVAWEMLKSGGPLSEAESIAKNLDISQINNEEIETEEVGAMASKVSAIPEVRAELLDFQRRVSKSPKGAVLDGRDIGTVICPNANFKFYITAEAEVRAKRRFDQLRAKGKKVVEADILKDILARDERDSNRNVAPLLPAIDAIYIDTTNLTVEQVFDKVCTIIDSNS